MTKLVNIPGTTSFIPLDDVINIKIHGKLISQDKVVFPETSEDNFQIISSPVVIFEVVTTYVDDTKVESDDVEEEPEDDADKKKKKSSSLRRDEALSAEDEDAYKVISKKISEIPVLELSTIAAKDLDDSLAYQELSPKAKELLAQRFTNYKDYLEYTFRRDELLNRTSNRPTITASASALPVDTMTTGGRVAEEEEEGSTPKMFQENFDPDQARLTEINEWLAENEESNNKRVEFIKNKLEVATVTMQNSDGIAFLNLLLETGIDPDKLKEIETELMSHIEDIKEIVS